MSIISGGMFVKFYLQSTPTGKETLGGDKRLWHNKSVAAVVIMLLYAIAIDWLGFLTVTLLTLFILYKIVIAFFRVYLIVLLLPHLPRKMLGTNRRQKRFHRGR
jgi:hypothetical protein